MSFVHEQLCGKKGAQWVSSRPAREKSIGAGQATNSAPGTWAGLGKHLSRGLASGMQPLFEKEA
jgi:hypothetical protein